jgi:hypothetical protein
MKIKLAQIERTLMNMIFEGPLQFLSIVNESKTKPKLFQMTQT